MNMKQIVGITFEKNGRLNYFYIEEKLSKEVKKGYNVIVDTERGLQLGKIVTDIHPIDEKKLEKNLKSVVKSASKKDYITHINNMKEAKEAFKKCNQLIKKYELDMRLLDATFTFDRDQLIFRFYFTNKSLFSGFNSFSLS